MTTALRRDWLVTDLDGTLVDRDLQVPARNLVAVRQYRAAGGTVVIATGRNEESAGRYHAQLGLTTPLILYNGARIVDPVTGRRILDLTLGDAWPVIRDQVLPRLSDVEGAVAFHDLAAYVLKPAPALSDYAQRDGITLHDTPVPGAPTKIMVISDTPDLSEVSDLLDAIVPAVRQVKSEKTYLEILPATADKGSALRLLAGRAGVGLDRVAAIGDNPNDLELILTAGLGVAVGDGHPLIRQAADLVVSPCSQGAVADLVDHLLGAAGTSLTPGRGVVGAAPLGGKGSGPDPA